MKTVRVKFSVKDTGTGIENDYLPHLFQSFSQADTSVIRKFGGTGLGLSICNKLVKMMDGEISVESNVGKGSAFTFTAVFDLVHEVIDLYSEEKEKLNLSFAENTACVSIQDYSGLIGRKVLLVEDNFINQFLALELLEKVGVKVVTANNGLNGVEAFQKEQFDAVLMDIQMPEMDGYEALEAIRNLPNGKIVPVIAMTAHAMEKERERCTKAGMNGFIAKPVDSDQLYTVLLSAVCNNHSDAFIEKGLQAIPEEPLNVEPFNTDELSTPKKTIDVDAALRRIGGNTDLLNKIFQAFIDGYENVFEDTRFLMESKDWEGLANFAHTLKGVAANLSAEALYKASLVLEEAARSEDEKAVVKILATFDIEMNNILLEAKKIINGPLNKMS